MRVPVQYCPYCGEEDLRPEPEAPEVPSGAWSCADCHATFAVTRVRAARRPEPSGGRA